jgi:hypothetical protein
LALGFLFPDGFLPAARFLEPARFLAAARLGELGRLVLDRGAGARDHGNLSMSSFLISSMGRCATIGLSGIRRLFMQKHIRVAVLSVLVLFLALSVVAVLQHSLRFREIQERIEIIQDVAQVTPLGTTEQENLAQLQERKELLELRYQLSWAFLLLTVLGWIGYLGSKLLRLWSPTDQLRHLEKEAHDLRVSFTESPDINKIISLSLNQMTEYYTISKSQARNSFWISVLAIVSGLLSLLFGIFLYYFRGQPQATAITAISTFGGVLAQFIGAAYLYIYRKSLSQLNLFFQQLAAMEEVMLAAEQCDKIKSDEHRDTIRGEMILFLITGRFHSGGFPTREASSDQNQQRGRRLIPEDQKSPSSRAGRI